MSDHSTNGHMKPLDLALEALTHEFNSFFADAHLSVSDDPLWRKRLSITIGGKTLHIGLPHIVGVENRGEPPTPSADESGDVMGS